MGVMGEANTIALLRAAQQYPELGVRPRLVIAADPVASRAGTAERLGYERFTDDWRAVVEEPDVDLVAITTPNFAHRDVALAAVAAGKPFWIEKPVGRNSGELEDIVAAADSSGTAALVGIQLPAGAGRATCARPPARGKLRRATPLPGDLPRRLCVPPGRSPLMAIPAGPRRTRRPWRPDVARRGPLPAPRRPDRFGLRNSCHPDHRAPGRRRGNGHALQRRRGRRTTPRRKRGLGRSDRRIRIRTHRDARSKPRHRRPPQSPRIRGERHDRGTRVESRAAQRAPNQPQPSHSREPLATKRSSPASIIPTTTTSCPARDYRWATATSRSSRPRG